MNHPMNSSTPGKLIFDHPNTLVSVCLAAVIFQYFRNHPLRHRRWFMLPFAAIGLFVAIRLWHQLPEATRRYNDSVKARAKA